MSSPVFGLAPIPVALGLAQAASITANSVGQLTQAVRRGMGIGELPAILSGERASLVRILPDWTLGEVSLHLLFPADRLLSRAVRAVADAIVARVPREVERSARAVAG